MINLKDKLSHLSFTQACKLLRPQGKDHLIQGGKMEKEADGSVKMTIAFPDESALDDLAGTLARIMGVTRQTTR